MNRVSCPYSCWSNRTRGNLVFRYTQHHNLPHPSLQQCPSTPLRRHCHPDLLRMSTEHFVEPCLQASKSSGKLCSPRGRNCWMPQTSPTETTVRKQSCPCHSHTDGSPLQRLVLSNPWCSPR